MTTMRNDRYPIKVHITLVTKCLTPYTKNNSATKPLINQDKSSRHKNKNIPCDNFVDPNFKPTNSNDR